MEGTDVDEAELARRLPVRLSMNRRFFGRNFTADYTDRMDFIRAIRVIRGKIYFDPRKKRFMAPIRIQFWRFSLPMNGCYRSAGL